MAQVPNNPKAVNKCLPSLVQYLQVVEKQRLASYSDQQHDIASVVHLSTSIYTPMGDTLKSNEMGASKIALDTIGPRSSASTMHLYNT
mmetsp:Transcript_32920/g.52580  ORF Transcript_32920/g.52580 Transcript_32920/m.52580 type:complete len:88 (+) Transcript_32920:584-847(+)